jgi:hypothetical protein
MTAQDLFRGMMRDDVAPRLRALGWKGSGQGYELPDPRTWALLGFQLSRYNTAAALRFTINISVLGKDAWAAYRTGHPAMPPRPRPSANYGTRFSWKRIGDLLPSDYDIWWELKAQDRPGDVERVADQVYGTVAEYAMPEIRRLLASPQEAAGQQYR